MKKNVSGKKHKHKKIRIPTNDARNANKFDKEQQNNQNNWQSGENALDREHDKAMAKSSRSSYGRSSYGILVEDIMDIQEVTILIQEVIMVVNKL